ncbi:MAG TPA: hypothetical protein DCM68_04600 [Verrucomicrobia bacterium]|nr:hypothetical protein [Verrucomicrobiota bacterium]
MSTVMKELKAEISKLARREVHRELSPVKRVNAAQRGLIADLRRQVVALQKEVKGLRKAAPAVDLALPKSGAEAAEGLRFWISGKGVRALRKRLGLTQVQFGRLAGVSSQAVVNWESTPGKIPLRRKETRAKLKGLRALNRRAVKEILKKG